MPTPFVSASSDPDRRRRASRRNGYACGALISCLPLSDVLLRPSFRAITIDTFDTTRDAPFIVTVAYLAIMLLLAIPLTAGLWRFGFRIERGARLALVLAPLMVLVPASLLAGGPAGAVPNVVLMTYIFMLLIVMSVIRYDDEFVRGLLSAAAIGHAVVLVVVIGIGEYSWGRLTSRNSPNFWGFTAVGATLAALALRRWWLKIAIFAVGAVAIYLTQARGAMMAGCGGFLLAYALTLTTLKPSRRLALVIGSLFALALGGLLLGPLIAERLFLVGDAERGLDSGGTGRVLAWREAWTLIAQNPFGGVGFRQHNDYITRASSAHNAYLTVGSELGLVGLAAYVVFLGGAIVRAVWRYLMLMRTTDLAIAAYLFAFSLLGLLETYSLNTSSALMLLLAAWSWADRTERAPTIAGAGALPASARSP